MTSLIDRSLSTRLSAELVIAEGVGRRAAAGEEGVVGAVALPVTPT